MDDGAGLGKMVVMRTPRHDPAGIRRLLELRQAERLTYQQLSERSGVPVHVLTYRASRDRQSARQKESVPATFVEVLDRPPFAAGSIEVIGPLGHRVVVTSSSDADLLERVLRALPC